MCFTFSLTLSLFLCLTSFGFACFFTFLTILTLLYSPSPLVTHSRLAPFYCVWICFSSLLLFCLPSPSLFQLSSVLLLSFHSFLRPSFRVYLFCVFLLLVFCLFVSISYICLLAKFIRFSSSVFIFYFFFSFHLSLSFRLILLLSFNSRSTFILFYFPCLLYCRNHTRSFLFSQLHSQVNLFIIKFTPFTLTRGYLLGTFPSVRKVSSTQWSSYAPIFIHSHTLSLPLTHKNQTQPHCS